MIPRILHQIYFRDAPYSELNKRCHETWARLLPDFEIRHWRLDNLPDDAKPQWVQQALAHPGSGAGSNAGSFIRPFLLHKFGGIYLDNDIELLKRPELDHAYWCGWQRDGHHADVNMAACASTPGHKLNRVIMTHVVARPVDDSPLAFGPLMFTEILREHGLHGQGEEQMVGDVKVYSREKWYPWFHDEPADRSRITPETFGVHHWEGTWK